MTTTSSTKQQTLAAPLTFSGKGLHIRRRQRHHLDVDQGLLLRRIGGLRRTPVAARARQRCPQLRAGGTAGPVDIAP